MIRIASTSGSYYVWLITVEYHQLTHCGSCDGHFYGFQQRDTRHDDKSEMEKMIR